MKPLSVVTPPSIYHGFSTRKTFWEEKFTGKKQDELGFDSISLKCVKNMKTVYPDENYVVLNDKSVEGRPCINRESKSDELTI